MNAQHATTIAQAYSAFAAAYADGAEREFSEAMARYALGQARGVAGDCRSVLDVACGIGAACELFADEGLAVFGTDASATMLDQARSAAAARGSAITYVRQDMRSIRLPTSVDLVTCMYDSLNFMATCADLTAAFRAARGALRAGGCYVFDMYTPGGLARCWGDEDQVHTNTERHFVATRTRWDPVRRSSTKRFWGFDEEDGRWRRWDEEHVLQAYDEGEVRDALAAAGFEVHDVTAWCDGRPAPLGDSSDRMLVLARAHLD